MASMLGALKTQQIDSLALSVSALKEAERQGWGQLMFDQASPTNWDKYVGGKVPVTVYFSLQSTIERDPARIQAFINATHRAARWVAGHSVEEIFEQIEPFIGSTSRDSNLAEIEAGKSLIDIDGRIDEASFARGAKVYFREMTGIKPMPLTKVYAGEFIAKANEKNATK
jgi:NitT/TauT family transport system substrate-binding protein